MSKFTNLELVTDKGNLKVLLIGKQLKSYAKTLKTTTNVREMANELGYLNEEEMYGFTVKGASFTYTEQGGRFYGVYLYDVPMSV